MGRVDDPRKRTLRPHINTAGVRTTLPEADIAYLSCSRRNKCPSITERHSCMDKLAEYKIPRIAEAHRPDAQSGGAPRKVRLNVGVS